MVNNFNNKIDAVELSFYQYGVEVKTQGAANADGSAFKKGDILSFEVSGSDFDLNQPITIKSTVEINNVKMFAGTVTVFIGESDPIADAVCPNLKEVALV